MSYDPRFDSPTYPEPRGGNGGLFIGFLFGAGMLIAAGAYLFPVLHRQWNDADISQKVRMREAEARAEAEAEFRKTEARMKAEANAAAEKLVKLEIAPTAFKAVADKAGPAVVNISNIVYTDRGMMKTGEGSGVLYKIEKDADGLPAGFIVTNSHVVHYPNSGDRYKLTDRVGIHFSSGRSIYVENGSIYHDPFYDLAVVKFDASDFDNLVVAEWGNSDQANVGDWVVAIGSPFGLKQTVTQGIISAKGRKELRLVETEVLQTDASINSGNSGGPLLDIKGRVIGINVAIATDNGGGNTGIGFSIPSNVAKNVIDELLKPPHRIMRGFLGVTMGEIDPQLANQLKLQGGAFVNTVRSGSPAEKAGLQATDLIIRIRAKGKETVVRNSEELRHLIRDLKPNEKITLEILRGLAKGIKNLEPLNIEATLEELPPLEPQQLNDRFWPQVPQQQGPRPNKKR